MRRISIYLFVCLFLTASCNEKVAPESVEGEGTQICFSIPQDLSTKSPVYTDADLRVNNSEIHVHGTKSGAVMTHYDNTLLTYNAVTGLWNPPTPDRWDYDGTNHVGYDYSFWAYGFNRVNVTGVTPTLSTTGDNFGKTITLVQPASYVHSDSGFGYDYLLSQVFNATSFAVTNGGNTVYRGPVVHLHMEHALALIEVRIKVQKDLYNVKFQGVEVRDFARGGTITCSKQAEYGNSTGDINQWTSTSLTNSGSVYSRGSVLSIGDTGYDGSYMHEFVSGRTEAESEMLLMLFTAVPQQMKTTTLKVAMLIQEIYDGPVHQLVQTWNLDEFYNWESGYKNVYTISIDTSSELDATINDWPSVNNVSGTILPKL